MAPPVSYRRRTCIGLALGLAADLALPRELATSDLAPPGTPRHVRYRVVHHFSGRDGTTPQAGLVVASDGQAYGTTDSGGEHQLGVIYRLTRDHRLKVVHSFAGGALDGARPSTFSLLDVDGALYGSTSDGGIADLGVAYRLEPANGFTMLHGFDSY